MDGHELKSSTTSSLFPSIDPTTGVIARLRCLEILNGGEISSDERMDAEKRYLQQQLTLREQDEPIESEERLRELEVKYSMFKVEDLPSSLPPTLRSIGENLIGVRMRMKTYGMKRARGERGKKKEMRRTSISEPLF